ncbi:MAG: NAD-dependent succinate-semialdehyde dehydrogenase [Actinobacteria bacterium]|nr:NAD-dependent succinate-semialdehyde dehydrogenase [Actinomycetota bacterium]
MTEMTIDGAGVGGEESFDVVNPSTGDLVARAPIAGKQQVDAAVEAAHRAGRGWRDTPAVERGSAIMRLVSAVRDAGEEMAELLTREQGKPLAAAHGEIAGFCALMEFYAQEARRIAGRVLESDHPDRFVYVLRQPVGVVAAIPPWNDPLHLLGRMIGPALAAGCTVVAKPASETPLTTLRLGALAAVALPPGVLNVITGPGPTVGEQLVRHPLVAKVALTGSVDGGRSVMRAAADGIKSVTLELGGQCPCIVWHDADIDKAVDAITFQGFRGSGQVCNRVNRVLVHEAAYDRVVAEVAELASRIVVGDGFAEGVDLGPLINRRQLEWVAGQVDEAVAKGARVVTGGKPLTGDGFDRGFFYQPTVLADCTPDMGVMQKETFGPVLAFASVGDDLDAAFDLVNSGWSGLSAFFFGGDQRDCWRAARELEAGSVWINDIHGSMVQAPYGGMKQSGLGREQGSVAVDEYLELKTVYHEMSDQPRGPRLCVHR